MNNTDVTAVTTLLGVVITVVFAGLIWLIKSQQKQAETTMQTLIEKHEQGNKINEKLIVTLDKQIESAERQELATEKWQKYVTKRFDQLEKINKKAVSTALAPASTWVGKRNKGGTN